MAKKREIVDLGFAVAVLQRDDKGDGFMNIIMPAHGDQSASNIVIRHTVRIKELGKKIVAVFGR